MDWKMCWFDGAKQSTFYSTLFPLGFCYSQNFVEFSAQNLNNTYLGQNSQFWLREMSFFFFLTAKETGSYEVSLKTGQAEELRLHLHEQLSWPNRSLPLKMRGLNTLPSCLASIHTALCIPWTLQFLTGASLFRQLLVRLRMTLSQWWQCQMSTRAQLAAQLWSAGDHPHSCCSDLLGQVRPCHTAVCSASG